MRPVGKPASRTRWERRLVLLHGTLSAESSPLCLRSQTQYERRQLAPRV